ncbi:MAG: hypothetical protein R6U40_11965 [Desulfobacterales bacterium]
MPIKIDERVKNQNRERKIKSLKRRQFRELGLLVYPAMNTEPAERRNWTFHPAVKIKIWLFGCRLRING